MELLVTGFSNEAEKELSPLPRKLRIWWRTVFSGSRLGDL